MPSFITRFSRLWFPALLILASAGRLEAGQCGTPLLFEPGKKQPRVGFKSGGGAYRNMAPNTRARTLETDHFLIHYSLRGLHKVRVGPEDSAMARLTDSLYIAFAALPDARRDSAVYTHLDAASAAHPAFILRTAEDLEGAWNYYVVKLGMKAPQAFITSVQYNITATFPRKFPVDIVDVGTADRDFFGETYAVTYPPDHLSITFENDFLWDTSLDPQGRIQGKSIKSQVAGKVLHDYGVEWPLGIKVTAYHEFYHAVQFTYNPRVLSYHAWYEISAVGMEERNAPEVNDYFQYLPCVLKNHERVGLTSMSQGPCTHFPMYGHGIFHVFLSQTLDDDFDVKVWEELSRNGDVLRNGLEFAFSKYGKTMADLYPDYAAQLLFSGTRFHRPTGLFSPDMPLWTDLATDSLDMSDTSPYRLFNLPATTFVVLKVAWSEKAVLKVLQAKGISGITRIHADADTAIVEQMTESQFTLGAPKSGFKEYYLVIPNASLTDAATVEIKDPEAAFYAFPNPVRTTSPATLFFSQAKDMTFPARVEIYGENGILLRSLTFATEATSLAWDLKDELDQTVKPGIYYYRLGLETLRPLVVLR